MFILSYKLGNVQSTDVTVAVPAPVDCRIESAHIICSVAVASGASPKVSCEVYADDDATKLLIADSQASGFAENAPVPYRDLNNIRLVSEPLLEVSASVRKS